MPQRNTKNKMKTIKTKQVGLSKMEACLKEMAFVGMVMNKTSGTSRKVYFFNTFEIKRRLPNFVEFIDKKYLEELSEKFGGPLIFIGGTTEFEVPTFMRAKIYPSKEENLLRLVYPSEFKTYEVFVDPDKIETRIFYKQRRGSDYFCYEHYLRADGIEEITSYPIEDFLEQTI